jgi:hypothetical protein
MSNAQASEVPENVATACAVHPDSDPEKYVTRYFHAELDSHA